MADSAPGPVLATGGKGTPTSTEPSRWQSAVARRSAEARATVPDIDYGVTVEVDRAVAVAAELEVGLTALWARACGLALRAHPRANGAYRDGHFESYERVNVGVLVATPEAYAIPTVFDADRKSVTEIAAELRELGARAQAGELRAPELSGATFTLSDLGPQEVQSSTPLIVPPQAAAVATGLVRLTPVVRNGAIVPAHTMSVTLACDHRVLYGAAATGFLRTITNHLREARL